MSESTDQQQPGTGRPKNETGDEFFCVGPPLHAVRASYIARRADELTFEALLACRYVDVIAPDRSGKSSLVAATAARLEAHGHKVAILDLEQISVREAGNDPGRWYYSVAYRLLRQLRIRFDLQAWWQDKSLASNRQRLVDFYSEVILRHVAEPVVVFVDEVECVAELPFADQLLASVRAAHNARRTDPDFSRLTFALIGECDPQSLIQAPEASPFEVTQSIPLDDFSRVDLDRYSTELGLAGEAASRALDRIYHWTRGQPYLTQKLARAVSREAISEDIDADIDQIVMRQLAGRAALHSEPMMNHIHRRIVEEDRRKEALLTLYGRLRKGIEVPTDMGSALQRKLMAVGLIEVDVDGQLKVRNRIFASVFTARWANENLPAHWRGPAVAVGLFLVMIAIPFWYTQLLPNPYVRVLTSSSVEPAAAETTWSNFRSFPGHADAADKLYEAFLVDRARTARDLGQIEAIAALTSRLPERQSLADELRGDFWQRRSLDAMRQERRDAALLATIESLLESTPERRNRVAMLIADDYPLMLASLDAAPVTGFVFDPGSLVLTATDQARVLQWNLTAQGLERRDDWRMTALEVTPLLRRVIVDREGTVSRVGLTLTLSHPRVADLRIKLIAPSGRTVEVDPGVERAAANQDLRIPAAQLRDLRGETLSGTWSLSLRDEETGVSGHLVGWNLTLDSQVLVEDFQRGLDILDPVETETERISMSGDGRFAFARAMQSDSARIWDLAFAQPVRAVAVSESEEFIGVDSGARRLVTATVETVSVWDTASGNRVATLPVGPGSIGSRLTGDGAHLFVERRGDTETTLELWSLDDAQMKSRLLVGGSPALVALDDGGSRIAIADFDRAVRVWDFAAGQMLAQLDLRAQPSRMSLSAGGDVLGVVYGNAGAAMWRIETPQSLLLDEVGRGQWQLEFSPSGSQVVVGQPGVGYQLYRTRDGQRLGPSIGAGGATGLLAFSADEKVLVTGGPGESMRFWSIPPAPASIATDREIDVHTLWSPAADSPVVATPDAATVFIGDRTGHVHRVENAELPERLVAAQEELSFIGHSGAVRMLVASPDGLFVASAADDNTIRIWNAQTGEPLPFAIDIPAALPSAMAFAPDSSLLAILLGARLEIVNVADGGVVAAVDFAEPHAGIVFADSANLYVGSDSGALSLVSATDVGNWNVRRLWSGDAAVRHIAVSPDGRFLVIVDAANTARQFNLAEARTGGAILELPGEIREIVFAPSGYRVVFRTGSWAHEAILTAAGLQWQDAILLPRVLNGARMVFGDRSSGARGFMLPVLRDGYPMVEAFRFSDDSGPGLFGSREELLLEWRRRLAVRETSP